MFSSTTQNTQIDFFTQTLTELNLSWNQIRAQGAKDLCHALREKGVRRIFSSSTQKTHTDFFTQTLNTLDLQWNKIGDEGAKYLSHALRVNRVSTIFPSSTKKHTDRLFHTDTHRIKSVLESNRSSRSKRPLRCITREQSEADFLFFNTKDT